MRLRRVVACCLIGIGISSLLRSTQPWIGLEVFVASRTTTEPERLRDADRARQSPESRAFWGVDAVGNPIEACLDLQRAVATLRLDDPPPIASRVELLRYLEDGHPPSHQGAPLWATTVRAVERTNRWLLAQGEPVTLGALLLASTREAGGTSAGVLTAHNLVKELTLSGRRFAPDRLPASTASLAAALAPWRRIPYLPAGGYDRLGPIYHALAALTLVSWTRSPVLGMLAADYESARRLAHVGRDRPDPEKAQADRCGVEAGVRLLAKR